MEKLPPISFPLHTGKVHTISDVLERAVQDYTATGKANCAVMQLTLNTQILVLVGSPEKVNESVIKLVGTVLNPEVLLKH